MARNKKKILLVACIFLIGAALILILHQGPSSPNILFILLDAARADHISCYGYEKNTTPFTDEISHEGTLFLNHFSNGSHTFESIPSLFFSRYYTLPIFQQMPWTWGKQEHPSTISNKYDNEQILLPEIL